jgi:hypothetical protein
MHDRPNPNWENALDFTEPRKDPKRHNAGIQQVQDLQRTCQGRIGRAFHEKQLLGAFGDLVVRADLPPFCRHGPFATPGTRYRTAVRFSNGQGCPMADALPDVRGVALKFFCEGTENDLVMTNTLGALAPDADQFMDFAHAYADGAGKSLPAHNLEVFTGLLEKQGVTAGLPNFWTIIKNAVSKVSTIAGEEYWGAAVRFGQFVVKYTLQPESRPSRSLVNPLDKDYLRDDLKDRLSKEDLRFKLGLQFFLDRERTPLHVAHEKWEGPIYWVADLMISRGAMTQPNAEQIERDIERMPFDPSRWFDGVVTDFQQTRGEVYRASQQHRGASRTQEYIHYWEGI